MAIGALRSTGTRTNGNQEVIASATKGVWTVANDDCRTAQSAAMLLSPATITDSTFHWVKVPQGATKVLVRARVPIATTSIGTAPTVRVIGAYENGGTINSDGSMPSDGTVCFARLDAATWAGTALTVWGVVTLATAEYRDASYYYSNVTALAGYALLGADYVGIPVVVASATTATAAVEIQVLFA